VVLLAADCGRWSRAVGCGEGGGRGHCGPLGGPAVP
jgi:hypothetical protein